MKILIINLSLIIFLLYGCSRNNEEESLNKEIVYYDNGVIKTEVPLKEGLKHGIETNYTEEGEVMSKLKWVDGIKHGQFIKYKSDNGGVDEIASYYKGKLLRHRIEFFVENQADYLVQYVHVGDTVIPNQFFNYYPSGTIKRNSSVYFSISNDKGTLKVNEKHKIGINLDCPYFKEGYMEVVVGGIDEKFQVVDSTTLDTIRAKDWSVELDVQFKNVGLNFVRGYILNRIN